MCVLHKSFVIKEMCSFSGPLGKVRMMAELQTNTLLRYCELNWRMRRVLLRSAGVSLLFAVFAFYNTVFPS